MFSLSNFDRFLFIILMILGSLAILYRLALVMSAPARGAMIRRKTKNLRIDQDVNHVLTGLSYQDWFVLDMLGYNLNKISFKDFIQSIDESLCEDERSRRISASSSPPPGYNGKD